MLNKTNENQQPYAIDTAVPFAEVGTRIHFIKCSFNDPLNASIDKYTNGDAILLESNGKFALIDTGEGGTQGYKGIKTSNVTGNIVIPYLRNVMGDNTRLEFFLGTHAHSDHIDGFPQILDNFNVGNIYMKPYLDSYITNEEELYDNQYQYNKAVEKAQKKGKTVKSVPNSLTLGEMKLTFLNHNVNKAKTTNQHSVVTVVQAKGQTAALMGDFGYEPDINKVTDEVSMANQIKTIVSKITLLKPGHHSVPPSSSAEFLNILKPSLIVSSGSSTLSLTENDSFSNWIAQNPSTYVYHTHPNTVHAYVATFYNNGITVFGSGATNSTVTPKGTWKNNGGNWYYNDANGNQVVGNYAVDGKLYHFDATGLMRTGWLQIGGSWYYFDTDGAAATGWKILNGKWYYLNPDNNGIMASGWLQPNHVDKVWYYCDATGAMRTGWLQLGGDWYFLESNDAKPYGYPLGGRYTSGTYTINGKSYNFNASGVCTNP